MKFRAAGALLLAATSLVAATPAKKVPPKAAPVAAKKPAPKPKTMAPDTLAHGNAMFLSSLSDGGKNRISLKAAAIGTRFFLEEPAGVSVYVYDGLSYRRESFLRGTTLEKAMRTYKKKM